jgi:hypothetical protein
VADDIQVQSQGQGGNGFKVDLKQRSLGITGPVVIPVVTLLLVGAIGWIRSRDLKDSLDKTNTHLQAIQTLVLTQVDQLRALHLAHRDLIHQQHQESLERLRENRDVTGARLDAQNALLSEQTQEMRKQHAIMIWNQGHEPGEHLTLDLPFPPERPSERPR